MPGRILGYGYLLIIYTSAGKSKKKFVMSSVYELVISTFSAFFFFCIGLMFEQFSYFEKYKIYLFFICFMGLFLLHPFVLKKCSHFIQIIAKKKIEITYLNYWKVLSVLFGYLVIWVFLSVAFFLFSNSIIPIDSKYFVYFGAAFAISTFSGLLAFFLPAGLGAREGVLILLLTPIVGSTSAIVISLASRLWMISGDLLLFSLATLYSISHKEQGLIKGVDC